MTKFVIISVRVNVGWIDLNASCNVAHKMTFRSSRVSKQNVLFSKERLLLGFFRHHTKTHKRTKSQQVSIVPLPEQQAVFFVPCPPSLLPPLSSASGQFSHISTRQKCLLRCTLLQD